MRDYKVCVYAICKNEENFVDRWMDSMSEADVVIVTDTGSEDSTVQRLKERGAIVYSEEIKPWRFDVARNLSLEHVPMDVDICVCTDLDEVFEAGWREHLERAWSESELQERISVVRNGRYLYNWSVKPDGTPGVQFVYFKVHERNGFRWACPVHEYIAYEGKLPLRTVFIDGMILNHYPDSKKSRGSYLPLLELAVEEEPENDRMCYYLGREYMYKSMWKKCIATLEKYLGLPTALWNEERCAAMRWIAKSYMEMGNTNDAYCWYYRAIAEAPHMREPYVEFAKLCSRLRDWEMTLFLTGEALKIKKRSQTYINMEYAWDYSTDDMRSIAAYYMNMKEISLEHAKQALSYAPNDERLKNNLKIVEDAIKIG